jgi:hypothetical protein
MSGVQEYHPVARSPVTEMLFDSTKGEVMGKLDSKVAVITGGSSGMALASAKPR